MARGRRSSFRDKVSRNSQQQRSKTANYGHLLLPRGINIFKEVPGGRVSLDFLPYVVTDKRHPDRDEEVGIAVEDSLWYRRPYKLHRNIGADNVSIVCPTSFGGKCPICDWRAKMLAEGTKWDDKVVKSLRPSDRNLYYVVPKQAKDFEEKPHIWDISQFLFQKKLNDELAEDDNFNDFPDLESGLTLRIRFSEEEFEKNKFADTARIDFAARDYKYTEADIEKLPPLDDVLDVKTYRDIERIFLDEAIPEDAEKPSAAGHRSPDADDDDDDDNTDRRTELRAYDAGVKAARDGDAEDECPYTPSQRVLYAAWRKGWGEETERAARVKSERSSEHRREPEPEPEPETQRRRRSAEPEPAPSSRRKAKSEDDDDKAGRRAAPESEKSDNCPHGHRFGADNDLKKECDECKVWSACADAREAASKSRAA